MPVTMLEIALAAQNIGGSRADLAFWTANAIPAAHITLKVPATSWRTSAAALARLVAHATPLGGTGEVSVGVLVGTPAVTINTTSVRVVSRNAPPQVRAQPLSTATGDGCTQPARTRLA